MTFNSNSIWRMFEGNRPRSIYQYSSMAPRLSGQNCKFFKFLLSLNSQRRLGYKENNTKYRSLTWKPRSHVRILIYRTWPIGHYRKNPLAYSGYHIEWGYIIWKRGYYQGNPLAWMDGLHYLWQSIDKAWSFEFLLQMELLLPEAALNM